MNQPKAVTQTQVPAMQTGGRLLAIVPTTWAEVAQIASAAVRAGMVPASYKDQPDKAAIAIMQGLEVGMPPMAALQSIAVINGIPALYGDGLLGVVRASGYLEDIIEEIQCDDNGIPLVSRCRVKRKGEATWSDHTLTQIQAKKAGWWSKPGPWSQTPQRMMQLRPRSWALRDKFADVLKGLQSAEEVEDMRDITPHGSATTEPPPPEPQRDDPKYQQLSGGTPHNDTPPVAGQGAAATRDAAPAGGGESPSGQPGEKPADKPKNKRAEAKAKAIDVVDEAKPSVNETETRPVVQGEIDTEVKFDRYTSAGKFYDFSDTFLQSAATTPAQARAWRAHYDPEISKLLTSDRASVRAEINDTLTLYLRKVGVAPVPEQQREPGEEG